ncbi:hypothetical protein AJ79_03628 [Helicocarpus griseus UAMH5409]|uniref:lytic cellulose monooxygenase (C4-dehydrogenating) n=1 Tax=Helicocarpus griseus UAMH5409 TaxID=1447875 RepID=A0A2B7XY56_9EURO|nr:hypothetical protein AJ79_03628 [Helicocarpus griseus UAMH5409]
MRVENRRLLRNLTRGKLTVNNNNRRSLDHDSALTYSTRPILTYMAKVDSAASANNPSSLEWFKIAETGLDGQTWAIDTLNQNGGKWDVQIPSSIAAGEYLVRQEIIALHSAYSAGGAQFYIGCAQVKVTGGGSASPSTVKIPGVYPANDPGIVLNIYDQSGQPYPASYQIPGPEVFSG